MSWKLAGTKNFPFLLLFPLSPPKIYGSSSTPFPGTHEAFPYFRLFRECVQKGRREEERRGESEWCRNCAKTYYGTSGPALSFFSLSQHRRVGKYWNSLKDFFETFLGENWEKMTGSRRRELNSLWIKAPFFPFRWIPGGEEKKRWEKFSKKREKRVDGLMEQCLRNERRRRLTLFFRKWSDVEEEGKMFETGVFATKILIWKNFLTTRRHFSPKMETRKWWKKSFPFHPHWISFSEKETHVSRFSPLLRKPFFFFLKKISILLAFLDVNAAGRRKRKKHSKTLLHFSNK